MNSPDAAGQDHEVDALRAALDASGELWLPIQGDSMGNAWAGAERIRLKACATGDPRIGDVVVFERDGRLIAHRILARWGDRYLTKGDARWAWDRPPVRRSEIVGVAVELQPGVQLAPARARALWELVRAVIAWPFLPILRRFRYTVGPPRSSG